MGRPTRQIKGYTPEMIRADFAKKEDYKIGLKLYAIYQVSLGKSSRSLQELYQVSFSQILSWVGRYEREGLNGLKDRPGRGRKSRLSDHQKKQLRSLVINESPEDYGYNTDTWTGPLLIEWIKNHYHITYKRAHIYNILKSLGLSYQKGRGVYPEADKQEQEAFKEGVKKTSKLLT